MRMPCIRNVLKPGRDDMAQQGHQDIQAEAITWHLRLRDGEVADWEAFTLWLEADPARSLAYDAVALADAELVTEAIPGVPFAPAANDDGDREDRSGHWGRRAGWATAMAAVAALFVMMFVAVPWLTAPSGRYEVATAAGERRTVAIADGSSATLNGSTRLILDHSHPRYVELASGEAAFAVRHDASDPFVVVAGEHRIQDVGTAFNLVRDRNRFSVEVIEGAVLYNPDRDAVPLTAGQTLLVRPGDRQPVLGRRDPASIAGWRSGQLNYSSASLEMVASDLSRSLGTEIIIDPDVAALPFTGSIRLENDAATLPGFAATLGLQARRSGSAWRIEPHSRAPR